MRRLTAPLALLFVVSVMAQATVYDSCDLNGNLAIDAGDIQYAVNMALSTLLCTANINGQGVCNAVTLQRVTNDYLGFYSSVGYCPVSNGSHAVLLSWNASSIDDGGVTCCFYNVYRSSSQNGTYTLICIMVTLSNVPGPSGNFQGYLDTTVVAGQTYWYEVSTVSNSGIQQGTTSPVQANIPSS